jgi:predicted HNH restriction endonuclease
MIDEDIALLKRISRAKYLKEYKEQRKKHFKELKITLDMKTYKELQKEALKYSLSPNKLIVKQALAYKDGNYLVPSDTNKNLQQLIFLFRNIANNINQIAKQSNIFKKLIGTNSIVTNLQILEKEVINFIQKPPSKL